MITIGGGRELERHKRDPDQQHRAERRARPGSRARGGRRTGALEHARVAIGVALTSASATTGSPSERASSPRAGLREASVSARWPRAASTSAVSSPIAPAPSTSTRLSRIERGQRDRAHRDRERLGQRAGAVVDRVGQREQHALIDGRPARRSRRARPVPRPTPRATACGQTCSSPARQRSHSPHCANGRTATRSPTRQPSTPSPSALMRPLSSWPGPCPPGSSAGTSRKCRSDPQIPQKATSSSAWPRPAARARSSTVDEAAVLGDRDGAQGSATRLASSAARCPACRARGCRRVDARP